MTEKKLELMVEQSSELKCSPGDFGAKIVDDTLLLPEEVYSFFVKAQATRNAGSLVATYQHFPSYKKLLAKELGWEVGEVQEAYENLVELVRDYVPERYLKWGPRQYVMGARNLAELKKK